MSQLQYKTNDLFRPGSPGHLNACVGQNGGPYGFADYSLGYFDAARAVVQATINVQISSDIAVYPIVYTYRHGIELGLKHLADFLPKLWNETAPQIKATHELVDVWSVVKPYLARDRAFDIDGNRVPYLDKVLADIIQFDPKAEVFRFPTDRGGRFYLQDSSLVDVTVLAETLEEVRVIFEDWFNIGTEMMEHKQDAEDEEQMFGEA